MYTYHSINMIRFFVPPPQETAMVNHAGYVWLTESAARVRKIKRKADHDKKYPQCIAKVIEADVYCPR